MNEDKEFAATHLSDAFCSVDARQEWGGSKFGRRIVDSRSVVVPFRPRKGFDLLSGWAAKPAGITQIGCGARAVFSICCLTARECVAEANHRLMVGNTRSLSARQEIKPEAPLAAPRRNAFTGPRLAAV